MSVTSTEYVIKILLEFSFLDRELSLSFYSKPIEEQRNFYHYKNLLYLKKKIVKILIECR